MYNSIEDIKEVLYFAQEIDNQSMINACAEELAFKMIEKNPRLSYKDLLFQYGYSNDNNSIFRRG